MLDCYIGWSTKVLKEPRLWPWIVAAVPCPVTHWRLRAVWRRAASRAGCAGLRLNDLRHAMAQWATDAGADLPMIQATLGHTTVVMTGRYARRRLRADHARILGNLLGGATESPAVGTAEVAKSL